MTVLCKCGCGTPTNISDGSNGVPSGVPLKYIRGHNARRSFFHRIGLFWRKTEMIPKSGWPDCIEWNGALNENGYGVCKAVFGERLAHRVAYTMSFGKIPIGLEPDHLCRNRRCINQFHLELVPHHINALRGTTGKHMRTKYNKLTRESVEEIRSSIESQTELAARFGVSRSNISAVQLGRSWRAREWPKS